MRIKMIFGKNFMNFLLISMIAGLKIYHYLVYFTRRGF